MKLDALKARADQLGRMDLSQESKATLLIAQMLGRFELDNEPPTLAEVTQDTIDAARYRKLRDAHCDCDKGVLVMNGARDVTPVGLGRFDAWVDALPS